MTQLLVKLFVTDYEDTDNMRVRTSYGILSSVVGILCNVLLFAIKITIGLITNSISITADAFNNLSDAGSSIISFIGVKLAGRPADKEHPFGHGRLEYISALVVAMLILFVGATLFKSSVEKVIHPEQVGFQWILVVILCISILVKVWLSMFNNILAKRINSNVMKATSADARNDVIVTSATVISMMIGKLSGYTIDGWMGLIVSLFVLLSGFNIAKDTLEPLLGEAVGKDIYEDITRKLESYEGIIGSHDLIMHNYGPSHIMATIHAEVSNTFTMEQAHEIIDRIERDILNEMGIHLVIHMDPIETKDKEISEIKIIVAKIIKDIEPKAAIHDFRIVKLEECTNLIFDLVVPHSYNDKDEENLLLKVTECINEMDDKYQCIITIENSYVAEE